jgi:hypothetical protein
MAKELSCPHCGKKFIDTPEESDLTPLDMLIELYESHRGNLEPGFEADFIDSVHSRRQYPLSDKQVNVIMRMWDRYKEYDPKDKGLAED